MKAIVQTKFGSARDVLKLTEIDAPTPDKAEVLVRVHAAASLGSVGSGVRTCVDDGCSDTFRETLVRADAGS